MDMETRALPPPPDIHHPGGRHPSDWLAKPYAITFTAGGLFVLILGVALFLGWRQFETARHNALTNDRTTANLLADLILAKNRATLGILQSYARRPLFVAAVQRKDVAGANRHLADLQKNAEIDLTFVTDTHGILWANFPVFPEAIGKDLSSRGWYGGISARWQPYISTVFKLIVGDKPLAVAFCVPILDEQERIIGILANSHRLSFLGDAIERAPLSPDTTVNVIDRAGHILYSNKSAYREKVTDYRLFPIVAGALKEKKRQLEIVDPREGREKIYLTIVPVGDSGWSVVIERTRRDILRSADRVIIETGAISSLLFLLIIFFLAYLGKVSLLRKTEELLRAETRLRQSEESERETRDYLEKLIGYANAPIIVWDPQFRITRFNHAFEDLTGLQAAEVLGREIDLLFPEDRREECLGQIRQTTGGERWEVVEIPILHRDGAVRTVLWNSASIYRPEDKTVIATIAQGVDITDRKQAEDEICKLNEKLEQRVKERTAQLEATNKELDAFSYSVSHDLRAPLRSIDGFSQALLEDYRGQLDETGKSYLERVRKAAQRMGLLIDDLLKLSRVSRSELNCKAVDLSKMARVIVEANRKNNPDREVAVIIREGLIARGDPHLMQIVLVNLLDNAWKFTGKETRPRIEFGAAEKDGETSYYVRDNGAGFDMAYADQLFVAFQRLHAVEEFAGTGIGLVTAKRIINRHGGRIWGEGEVGKGATFYFTLPSQVIS